MLREVGGLQEHATVRLGIDDGLVAVLGVGDVALVLAWVAIGRIATTHVDAIQPIKVGIVGAGTHTHLLQTCIVLIPLRVACVDGMLETFDRFCLRLHDIPSTVVAVSSSSIQTYIIISFIFILKSTIIVPRHGILAISSRTGLDGIFLISRVG